MSERRQLINLAYRLLGSVADAEDVVQETYARWYAMSAQQREAIESPVAGRRRSPAGSAWTCSARTRSGGRRYVGEWLPELVPRHEGEADRRPADRVTLDESISMAFLVVLESMTPAERVAFVLHDVFRYPFADVAEIVGRTPAACRKLASSARSRIPAAPAPATPAAEQAGVVRDFKQAWAAKDIDALIGLLDPAATATGDGGGMVSAVLHPVVGASRSPGSSPTSPPGRELTLLERTVNGRRLVAQEDGIVTVLAFDIVGRPDQAHLGGTQPGQAPAWSEHFRGRAPGTRPGSRRAPRGPAGPTPPR